MSQIRSDLWCAAFVRRHNDLGQVCVVARKGDPIAGQVWIDVDHLDGTRSLFGPAPSLVASEAGAGKLFQKRLEKVTGLEIRERLDKEARFDPDFWLLGLETRSNDLGVDLYDNESVPKS